MTSTNRASGRKIKYWRRQRDLTQRELAQRTGVTLRAIQYYEAGQRSPDEKTLGRIARRLRVHVEDLRDHEPQKVSARR